MERISIRVGGGSLMGLWYLVEGDYFPHGCVSYDSWADFLDRRIVVEFKTLDG